MNYFLKHIGKEGLHHAYVCVGDIPQMFEQFEEFLREHLSTPTVANPDYRIFEEINLSIDTARALTVLQGQKNFGNKKQVFVIKTNSIGEETQNALLKIFEEPTLQTHFFVFIPQDILLPTLRSRVRLFYLIEKEKNIVSFLKLTLPERLVYIKKITDDISDEKKTKQDAINLINQIEQELYQDKGVYSHALQLTVCEKARTALFSRGAMTKMLLEHVALSI